MGVLDLFKRPEEKSKPVVNQITLPPAQLVTPNDAAVMALAVVAIIAVAALALVVIRHSGAVIA